MATRRRPHGTARLELVLGAGGRYALRSIPGGWRLKHSTSRAEYHVLADADGLRCDCGDFRHRRARDGEHCKHILALMAVRLVRAPVVPGRWD